MQPQQLTASQRIFQKPGVSILVISMFIGILGALLQGFLMTGGSRIFGDAAGAALMIAALTAIFILLPCWIAAVITRAIYKRAGVDYGLVRRLFWTVPAIGAWLSAAYTAFVGEGIELDTARGNGDDMAGLIFYILYMTASLVLAATALVLALSQLQKLKRASKA